MPKTYLYNYFVERVGDDYRIDTTHPAYGSYTVTDSLTDPGGDDPTVLGDVSKDHFDIGLNDSQNIDRYYYGSTDNGFVAHFSDPGRPTGPFYTLYSDTSYSPGAYLNGVVLNDPSDASTFTTLCFARGTLIATPSGDAPVEALAIGDLVLTADGRAVPVRWIGRQAIGGLGGTPAGREPVRIEAGALGEGLPTRDLVVTSDHALLLDGALVQAGALVNGVTISRLTQAELRSGLTVFHIETENHEIVLAEGVPAETFVDNVTRRAFDNYDEFEALYGPVADAVFERDEPRAMSARQVPASVRARIAHAAAGGMAEAA